MKTRQELKEEFKQIKYRMGVFQIKNRLNGKVFVGSSTDLKAAWFSQKLKLDTGMHPNSNLQKAWKEAGGDNFSYEILETLEEKDNKTDIKKELQIFEEMMIEQLQPFGDKGYHTAK
jgi:hypothetical protein